MTKRSKAPQKLKSKPKRRKAAKHRGRSKRGKAAKSFRRKRGISNERLETALRLIGEGQDLANAAKAIHASSDRFKRIALRKKLIRKSDGKWIVAGRLHRRMLLFSDGQALIVTTRSIKSASLIGRYMSAVRHFLKTGKASDLAEFAKSNIKDTEGKIHRFEINPNVLYRLASAGGEQFEDIYRIIV